MSRVRISLITSVALSMGAAAVHAVPVVTTTQGNGPGFSPFPVSNTDLLQTQLAGVTSSGNFTIENAGGIPILANGTFVINGGNVGVPGTDPTINNQLATVQDNAFIEIALNTSTNTLGYNISSIETFGGWNDSGRDKQLFTILFRKVGTGVFLPFDGVNADNPLSPGTPSAIRAVFDGTGILTGVDALRIEFPAGQENGYAGLGEIDVIGTPLGVPEPSVVGLAMVAAIGAMGRRARRRD
jgi:hypothetical protein